MYRYSEKPMKFSFPFIPADCSVFIISFKQGDIILEKTKADLANNISDVEERDGKYEMNFRFTQQECGAFEAEKVIYVQVTFVKDGYRDDTTVKSFTLEDVMKDEVV